MIDDFQRHIAVPKNQKGIEECLSAEYSKDNVAVFTISQEEMDQLFKTGIMGKLNSIKGVLIDDYESDFIPRDKLSDCLAVFKESNIMKDSNLALAMKAGLNYGFGIYTEF